MESDDIKREERELSCKLTEEETLDYSRRLAGEHQSKTQSELSKKQAMSEYTAQINVHESNISALSQKVSTGQEMRQVECWWHYDWENNEKTLFRSDTQTLVKIVEIEEFEKQQHLKLRKKKEKKADTEPLKESTEESAEHDGQGDMLYSEAVTLVEQDKTIFITISFLQKKLKIGYNRASRILEDLMKNGVVEAPDNPVEAGEMYECQDCGSPEQGVHSDGCPQADSFDVEE